MVGTRGVWAAIQRQEPKAMGPDEDEKEARHQGAGGAKEPAQETGRRTHTPATLATAHEMSTDAQALHVVR